MSRMAPVAIIGQGCVLPGALTPDALWDIITNKRITITRPKTRRFGLHPEEEEKSPFASGFVDGFEDVFDPSRYDLLDVDASNLDAVCQWPLHAAAEAWLDAGKPHVASDRIGVYLANLGYPSFQKTCFAADQWLGRDSGLPKSAFFNSGYPATLIAKYLNARGPVMALDAACASSLYAIALACQKLQSSQIDVALVGAVNAADNIILHRGFAALKALSPKGQSRPFHAEADGLVPSEGAAAVVLKRLSDITPSEHVYGVIRGIGLSNDGRRKGFLAPDINGQTEAMQKAWHASGLSPNRLDLLECHATGTRIGDTVEIKGASNFFRNTGDLPVSSLKANLGHLITVAGLSSLIKITSAMRAETLPPMPLTGARNEDLSGSQLTPLTEGAAWKRTSHPRRAALSNFGFGGNNAHLVIEEYAPETTKVQVKAIPPREVIVLCGVGLYANGNRSLEVLRRLKATSLDRKPPNLNIGIDARAAGTPPNDLKHAEPQQLAIFDTVRQALTTTKRSSPERIGVFAGTNCAGDSCRFILRDRLPQILGHPPTEEFKGSIAPPLQSSDVIGAMANIAANRLTFAEDIRGPGFAIMAEEASSLAVLDAAIEALQREEIDMAIVSAADFACEPLAHVARLKRGDTETRANLAATIVLKRRSLAEANGDTILGELSDVAWSSVAPTASSSQRAQTYGDAPAANLLFDLACEALSRPERSTDDGLDLGTPHSELSQGGRIKFTSTRSALDTEHAHPPLDDWNTIRPIAYPEPDLSKWKHMTFNPATCPLPSAPILPPPSYPSSHHVARSNSAGASPPRTVTDGLFPLQKRHPVGSTWERANIAKASRGKMSDFFGPAFVPQDSYRRQVRLPDSPLLFVDRITGIDAEPLVEAAGVIWTETDITAGSWFTHNGFVRPGPLIECGQADLTLISWMGADMKNKDERVYRLLGCEITFHEGDLPKVGDTLEFQIEITGHATLAETRMFFFQSDCHVGERIAFSVRNGQAGFFTDEELAKGKGFQWDAATSPPPTTSPTPFTPKKVSAKRSFSTLDVAAFRRGDAFACFGKGFEFAAAHSKPPCLPDGKLALFDDVPVFDPDGGPWGRGYLQARAHTPTDCWFYDGHFHEDPCMPGTLMAEAAVQAIEFYAAAVGLTIARDGFVFEPVPEHTAKFICRGQVAPDTDHTLVYEVFIDEIIEGETPVIYAAVLASSDGRKVFYCPRFGIRLRRNWPAPRTPAAPRLIGPAKESRGDHGALLDCANGAPSAAFGDIYAPFDTAGHVPRLPQPPYHMMNRVMEVSTRPGVRQKGARIVAEYDIPPDAWYFDANHGVMPFSVLTEVALQPCGWLASHCGFALEGNLKFRNLDGDGTIHREVFPTDKLIRVTTELSSFSRIGAMTIVNFELVAELGYGEPVMDLKTAFGFFPADALARQAGLSKTEQSAANLELPAMSVELGCMPGKLATGMSSMLDSVDYFDPDGGRAGLGLIRGQQSVDPYAWYFKAHFFQDPVQPGSLGLDMLAQLLGRAALLKGLGRDFENLHIETIAANMPVKWTYRGQVTPDCQRVTSVMEITEIVRQPGRLLITGHGSLWCDGLRIYQAAPLTLALREA